MEHPVSWKDISPASMQWFLERFTLHDSGLQRVTVDGWDSRTLVQVNFDLRWNPSIPRGYATLWISFDRPYRVTHTQGAWSQPTLEGAESAVLDEEQREALRAGGSFDPESYQHSGRDDGFLYPPDDDTLTRTLFQLMNWGKLELLHASQVRFAATDMRDTIVDLTTLTLKPRSG